MVMCRHASGSSNICRPRYGCRAGGTITTAKLNDVEPFAYLEDELERMSNGHPKSRLDRPLALELAANNHLELTPRARNGR
jgi:hypothetical protein